MTDFINYDWYVYTWHIGQTLDQRIVKDIDIPCFAALFPLPQKYLNNGNILLSRHP